jgi:hypothetical protein
MRSSRAKIDFSSSTPAQRTQAPDGLADAVRDALANEHRSDNDPMPDGGAPRPGRRGTGGPLGHRSGSRSGAGRRSQQPNGCQALRRRGG